MRRARTAALAVLGWLAIVVAASTLAWAAIDRAGRVTYLGGGTAPSAQAAATTPPTTAPSPTTPPAHGTGSSTTSTTSTTAAPPPTRHTTSASSSAAPATTPTARAAETSVAGGSVGVTCTGSTLSLRYATPQDGWSYTVERKDNELQVTFRRGGDGDKVEVHARCQANAPVFSTEDGSQDSSDPKEPEEH